MRQLNGVGGEIFSQTAQRLIRFGCNERQAYTLAKIITLEKDSSDEVVQDAVCSALVSAKQGADGITEVEYIGGVRRDTLRMEGG